MMARAAILGLAGAWGLVGGAGGLAAQSQSLTCAQVVVTARGEQARYEWLARTKARANWRARVRALPEFGAAFANWSRAMNAEERCLSGPNGTVCTLSGTPCRL